MTWRCNLRQALEAHTGRSQMSWRQWQWLRGAVRGGVRARRAAHLEDTDNLAVCELHELQHHVGIRWRRQAHPAIAKRLGQAPRLQAHRRQISVSMRFPIVFLSPCVLQEETNACEVLHFATCASGKVGIASVQLLCDKPLGGMRLRPKERAPHRPSGSPSAASNPDETKISSGSNARKIGITTKLRTRPALYRKPLKDARAKPWERQGSRGGEIRRHRRE